MYCVVIIGSSCWARAKEECGAYSLHSLCVSSIMGLSQESTRFPLEPLAMVKSAIIRTIVIKSVNCNADLDLALTVAGLWESRFEPGL